MGWVLQIKDRTFSSPSNQPHLLSLPTPPPLSSSQPSDFTLNNKVSPSILLIIIILAVIFFISGVLHLLVRLLFRPSNRNPGEIDNLTALQGQLQQLFHLHDSGVDQSFIDTLPMFNYKAIIGIKDPFDCAVCLSEFEFEDMLRLLPKCSHAFHMNCIDTWLLSHSTCPLCRASLVSDFPQNAHFSPVVMILESGNESSRERVLEREDGSAVRVSTHYDDGGDGFRPSAEDPVLKSGEVGVKLDGIVGEEIVSVKLGKFRNVGGEDEGSSEINGEVRRCFSMGSFAYIMDESSSLKVAIKTSMKNPGHRLAMSECGCDSRRELFNGFEAFKVRDIQSGCNENKSIVSSKRDSFSISKFWLRGRKDQPSVARMESSRRAYSFRFPVAAGETNAKNGGGGRRRRMSEIESQCNSLSFEDEHPYFGSTLLWLMGRQNKVVNSSFSSDV